MAGLSQGFTRSLLDARASCTAGAESDPLVLNAVATPYWGVLCIDSILVAVPVKGKIVPRCSQLEVAFPMKCAATGSQCYSGPSLTGLHVLFFCFRSLTPPQTVR